MLKSYFTCHTIPLIRLVWHVHRITIDIKLTFCGITLNIKSRINKLSQVIARLYN